MLTLVTFVFNTISLMIVLRSRRYFMLVVAPHFKVYAISLPEPNGRATKMTLLISTRGSSTWMHRMIPPSPPMRATMTLARL